MTFYRVPGVWFAGYCAVSGRVKNCAANNGRNCTVAQTSESHLGARLRDTSEVAQSCEMMFTDAAKPPQAAPAPPNAEHEGYGDLLG